MTKHLQISQHMSKRNEIRQKEQLQLQLQAQFNKLDQTVLSWLEPSTKSTSSPILSNHVAEEFGNQIVVPAGHGINFDDTTASNEGSNAFGNESDKPSTVTINDFLTSTNTKTRKSGDDDLSRVKKVGDMKKRGLGNASNSLRALSNKLRNDRRKGTLGGDRVDANAGGKPWRGDNHSGRNNAKFSELVTRNIGAKKELKKEAEDSDSEDEDTDAVLARKIKGAAKTQNKNKRPF